MTWHVSECVKFVHAHPLQDVVVQSYDPNVQNEDGDTAQSIACDKKKEKKDRGHPTVADCLGAIAGWPAFKIAAGCRLHADACRMRH